MKNETIKTALTAVVFLMFFGMLLYFAGQTGDYEQTVRERQEAANAYAQTLQEERIQKCEELIQLHIDSMLR